MSAIDVNVRNANVPLGLTVQCYDSLVPSVYEKYSWFAGRAWSRVERDQYFCVVDIEAGAALTLST